MAGQALRLWFDPLRGQDGPRMQGGSLRPHGQMFAMLMLKQAAVDLCGRGFATQTSKSKTNVHEDSLPIAALSAT